MSDTQTTIREDPVEPSWFRIGFPALRRVVVFALGTAVIIDALTSKTYVVAELIIGMILVGILPMDEVLKSATGRRRGRGG